MSYEAEFSTLVLERARFKASSMVTRQLLANADVRQMVDMMSDRLLVHLEAEVLEDRNLRRSIDYQVTEDPVYDSWRHWLVASLPVNSFRRRFLAYLWEIDPLYKGRRRIHELHIQRRGLFPENTMRYPDSLGRVHMPVSFDVGERYEDVDR